MIKQGACQLGRLDWVADVVYCIGMTPLNQTGNSMHIAPSNLRINLAYVLYQYVPIVTVIYCAIGIIWRTIASTRLESIYVWYSVLEQVLILVPVLGRSAG